MTTLCFLPVVSSGDSAGDPMRVNPIFLFVSLGVYLFTLFALPLYFFIAFFCIYCIILFLLTYSGYDVSFVMLGWVITFDKSYTQTWGKFKIRMGGIVMLNLREYSRRRRYEIPHSVEALLTVVFIYRVIGKTCCFPPGAC